MIRIRFGAGLGLALPYGCLGGGFISRSGEGIVCRNYGFLKGRIAVYNIEIFIF